MLLELDKIRAQHSHANATKIPRDQILYARIFDAILEQRLQPGIKLTEDEIAKIFHVNRSVVRQTLQRLQHDNIVEIRPNRGAYVANPDARRAREIFNARRLIESEIIREAIRTADDPDIDSLRDLVWAEREALQEQQRGTALRLSGDFHLRLVSVCDNQTLYNIQRSLIPLTSLIIARYEKSQTSFCSHEEHMQLLLAIESRNEQDAVARMIEHLNHIENKLDLSDVTTSADLTDIFGKAAPTTTASGSAQ